MQIFADQPKDTKPLVVFLAKVIAYAQSNCRSTLGPPSARIGSWEQSFVAENRPTIPNIAGTRFSTCFASHRNQTVKQAWTPLRRMSEDYTVFGYGSLIWKVRYICHTSPSPYSSLISHLLAAPAACHSQASAIQSTYSPAKA
jgi:hypothetical protein